MGSVLLAYDTKNGSTGEVASAIARRLEELGMAVTVMAARDVSDFWGFDAVVVGAPIYSGRWLSRAHRVLKRFARLAPDRRPVLAIFALGPRVDESPENWVRPRQQFDRSLGKHPSLSPVTVALFGGADPPRKSPRRDVRDWGAIAAWADEVAAAMRKAGGWPHMHRMRDA